MTDELASWFSKHGSLGTVGSEFDRGGRAMFGRSKIHYGGLSAVMGDLVEVSAAIGACLSKNDPLFIELKRVELLRFNAGWTLS